MRSGRRHRVVPAVLAVALFAAAPARADQRSWQIVEVVPPARGPDGPIAPSLRVRVTGLPAPSIDERGSWRLVDTRAQRRGIAPSRVTPYAASAEPLALVVLVEGHEYYLGNRTYTVASERPGEAARPAVEGIYDSLRAALDAPSAPGGELPQTLRNAGPPGSKGELIVYAGTADVRVPMGDLGRLDGTALGPEELQRGHLRRNLVEGLREAQAALHRVTASHKALIVISDGVDPHGLDGIASIKQALDRDKVATIALHLELPSDYLPADAAARRTAQRLMKTLGGEHYRKVSSPRALARQLAEVVRTPLNARFWLEFQGGPTPAGQLPRGPTWDGEEHSLLLVHDGEPYTEAPLTAVLPATPRAGGHSRWWLGMLLGGLGLGGLVAIGTTLRRRGRIAGAPGAVPAPVVQVARVDDPSLVGWLVPLDGPLRNQRLALDRPLTRLGTGLDVDVRFDDLAMSREHALIERSPLGFTLVDRGSTNGTRVNETRIERQLLVDHDVITLGGTRCWFRVGPR